MINPHFYHVTSTREQNLMKDLTREVIMNKGLDFSYIPRDSTDADVLFGEDVQSIFSSGVVLEMYCEEQQGFAGEGDFMSNFGLDIRDEATFLIAKDRFEAVVKNEYPAIIRPREGDLIYHSLSKSLFEITFAEDEKPFFQRGIQTVWKCLTKRFEYNRDIMDSGIAEVDELNIRTDTNDDDEAIQTEGDTFVTFNENDPFSSNNY